MEVLEFKNPEVGIAPEAMSRKAILDRIALNKRIIMCNVILLNRKKRALNLVADRLKQLKGKGLPDKIVTSLGQCLQSYRHVDDHSVTKELTNQEMVPDFIRALYYVNNSLTMKEVKHCMFITMNLGVKDVVDLTNSTVKSVEMARYRIKRKLNLKTSDSLYKFLINLRVSEATKRN